MRVRLYEVGDNCGRVHHLESLPIALSTTVLGDLCMGVDEQSQTQCVLREDHGNLVIDASDLNCDVFLNDLPIAHGGLLPGDSLRVGNRAVVVSYERVTTEPAPPCRFRLAH